MKKSAFISDILFSFAVTFLPALCLLRYLRLPLSASLLFAAVAGLLVSLPVWFFLDKKREKLCLKKQDEEAKEKLLLHLALSTQKQNAEYFAGYFSSKAKREAEKASSEEAPVRAEPVKVRTCAGFYAIETAEELCFPLFTVRPANGDEAAAIVRAKSDKQKRLLCGELSPEAEKLCAGFGIETTTAADAYLMLKKENFLPEHDLCEDAFTPQKKKRLHLYFAKSNSRRFLLGGVLILLTSLITPFPLYYLIFGSALVLSSIFVRIFGYR